MGILEDYFINPIIQGTGYNIVNTLSYGILLIIAIFLVVKIFKNWKIQTNEDFWLDLLPFVILGGVLRALQDMGTFAYLGDFQYFFVTPLIYFLIFALAIVAIAFRHVHERMVRYVGFVVLAIALVIAIFKMINPISFGIVIGITIVTYLVVYKAVEFVRRGFLDTINKYVVFGQIFDAAATITALSIVGGFSEQHVVPNFLFSFLPVWAFLPIKISIALLAIYVIDKETTGEWNWLLKFAVFVLGMAPGTRDSFALLFNG